MSKKISMFWRLGLVYLLLLLLVLASMDIYAVRILRREYVQATFEQLEALARVGQGRLPRYDDTTELGLWARWVAAGGARCTVVAADGTVLADSEGTPAHMENHAGRPEIRAALDGGKGSAVRYSDTLGCDMVYLALRVQADEGTPVVIRLALPVHRLDEALAGFRHRLWAVSGIILLLAGGLSLLFFRTLVARIDSLKRFSRRVADGDFRLLPMDRKGDELAELTDMLNETAVRLDRTIRTLTDERNRWAAILSSMEEGVALVGPDQSLLFCNESFRRALALEGRASEGLPVVEVVHEPELLGAVEQALAGRERVRTELVVSAPRARSFAVTGAPIRSQGGIAGALIVLHDISELRRLERARRDFVANISHEFKTPLTAIQGFAETLLGGALADPQNRVRFLEIIRDNAFRLGRLTDDLLKLSQIEAGKLQLEIRPVAVADLIEPCIETARLQADPKEIAVEAEYSADLPAILGDLGSLQVILQNLLDNAIRYTLPGGHIRVRARAKNGEVAISVSDTGVGIPEADQERIFERFYRVDAARSRAEGGTGLGLSISKHLVEAHGGCIEVQSKVGQGSTFIVKLPRA